MTRKKLIEVALPLEAINEASAREKSIRHGHPSTLHLWWARRPLAACRAVIFTSLVDDPDDPAAPPDFVTACRALPKGKNATGIDRDGNPADTPRMRLFDFIERLVTWEATTDEAILETARHLIRLSTGGNPPPLLDPFAGGGSIPLEAQRLGLEAHASDLNPVAVMINKALIEIPPKFANRPPVNPRDNVHEKVRSDRFSGLTLPGTQPAEAVTTNQSRSPGTQPAEAVTTNQGVLLGQTWRGATGLAADVRYYGAWMRERAWQRIGHLYPQMNGETVIAWLWARTVRCPNPACGAQMPLVRSFDLSTKKSNRAWVEPRVDARTRLITFEVKQASKGAGPDGTVNRQGATCLACKTAVPFDHIRDEGKAGQMGAQLMAIVTEGNNGRNYYAPTAEHQAAAQVAIPASAPDTDLPEQALGFRVQLYGMTKHRDLFTARQLVALTAFSDLVAEAREQVKQDALAAGLSDDATPLRDGGVGADAYSEAVGVYLSFSLDRSSSMWGALCWWQSSGEFVNQVFTRHALSMIWDYAEVNPFSNSSGNWDGAIKWVERTLEQLAPYIIGIATQQDAARLQSNHLFLISTDPPYYDNIGYADLSDYFYLWLRNSLRGTYPKEFETMLVPKEPELIANPYRFNGKVDAANKHFEEGLMQAFGKMRATIQGDYPLTVYYAFKQQEQIAESGPASTGWETMLSGLVHTGFRIVGTWPMRTERSGRIRELDSNALASSIVLVCRPRLEGAPMTSRREFVNALKRELPAALREMQSGNIAPVDLAQASIGPGMAVYSCYSQVLEPNGERLTVRTALQLINQVLDEHLAEQEGTLDADSRFAVDWFTQFGYAQGEFGVADVLARAKNTSVAGLVNAGIVEAGAGKVRLLRWDELDPGWDPTTDKRVTIWEATHHLIERLHTYGEQGTALLLARMPADLAAESRNLAYRLYSICERKNWAEDAREYNALVISWSASQEQAASLRRNYRQGSLFDGVKGLS